MTSQTTPSPATTSPRREDGILPRVGRLALKELRETLRDRRTIVTLVLMPVIVYPLLSLGFQRFLVSGMGGTSQDAFRLGVVSKEEGELIGSILKRGYDLRTRRDRQRNRGTDGNQNDIGKGNNSQPLAQQAGTSTDSRDAEIAELPIRILVAENIEEAVVTQDIDIGVRIKRKEAFRFSELFKEGFDCDLLVNDASYRSREAQSYVELLFAAVNAELYRFQLRNLKAEGRITAVRVTRAPVEIAGLPASKAHSLATLIPLVLILMTITGAVYPAIDLTAGERERGTLEMLIAAPVPRLQLLVAKYAAVVTVALLTATVNLVSMLITVMSMGLGPLLFGGSGISVLIIAEIFGLLLLFAAFFSALLLAVTSFARSFKEAQAYLIPLMLVSIAPGLLSMMPGLKLNGPLAVTPLVNIVLLARDLFEGEATLVIVMVVVLSTALFALAAIAIAARIFGTDAILYGASGTWTDLIRRPSASSPVPSLTSAFACLALIFPANFLLRNLIARTGIDDMPTLIGINALATLLLFGLFPFAVAQRNRVRVAEGFRLTLPPSLAIPAALLLGVSLWVFAHEVIVLQQQIGLVSLTQEQLAAAQKLIDRLRSELRPYQIMLALAVAPAACEEFFFRGYLLNALGTRVTPRAAILFSGIIFGLFHVIFLDSLAIERFVSSTLLGIVLGWICVRTGSLWPGMLLHMVHNGLLMLASYYQSQLSEWGLGLDQQADLEHSHLPASWIVTAAITATIGFGLMVIATRKNGVTMAARRSEVGSVPPAA